ncbi:MAG: phosphopantothenoylcysteine decarboxylase domain-containing protein [Planctomycetota bacterium]|jgi:phosphopantothenoylcysteine decarboxylase/phosphopantothenate--cysteine ligase
MHFQTRPVSLRFLITAGGTREYIDPVRFISNASSGRTGLAIARAALKAGHRVTLVIAPTTQRPPNGARIIKAETAAQMFEAVKKHFNKCDCLIMAAAVADYAIAKPSKTKVKKTHKSLTLKLKPTADILKWAGKHKIGAQLVVGFALEDQALRARAEKKMKEKNLDMIIANSPAAIGSDESTVQVKTPHAKWLRLPRASKTIIAGRIISLIESV